MASGEPGGASTGGPVFRVDPVVDAIIEELFSAAAGTLASDVGTAPCRYSLFAGAAREALVDALEAEALRDPNGPTGAALSEFAAAVRRAPVLVAAWLPAGAHVDDVRLAQRIVDRVEHLAQGLGLAIRRAPAPASLSKTVGENPVPIALHGQERALVSRRGGRAAEILGALVAIGYAEGGPAPVRPFAMPLPPSFEWVGRGARPGGAAANVSAGRAAGSVSWSAPTAGWQEQPAAIDRHSLARIVQQAKMASLGQLVAGVAHEINTPLAAVVSNNDLFLRAFERLRHGLAESGLSMSEPPLSLVRRDLDAVTVLGEVSRMACQRIVDIVRTLRTFARLDESDFKAVDLHECIDSTLVLIAHLLRRGVHVDKRYGALPLVECHPNQVNQLLMNLLVNACQAIDVSASGPTGTITIETLLVGEDHVQLAIADTGNGISAEHIERIFDPGFTTKGAGVGTGLGLSICYQIVLGHGGDISVQSTPGRGARFVVTLPVHSTMSR